MTNAADDSISTTQSGVGSGLDGQAETRAAIQAQTEVEHGFLQLLADFRGRLETDLQSWLADKERVATAESQTAHELTGVLSRFVARDGKRIRPALLYYTYRACRGQSEDKAMTMAMAVELLHTYLLIHDDIMDRADTRRGEPAVHLLYSDLHREKGWRGDSDRFGDSVAILLGDLAQSYSMELFASVEVAPEVATEFQACFATMCQEVIIGQYLEMTAGYRQGLAEDELLRVLQMKSGRYSVERPVQLGALLARAPEAMRSGLTQYGRQIGEAFQLQDDLLGMFGDVAKVGKPVGSDLVEGKFTILVHHALSALSPSDGQALSAALGNSELSDEEILAYQEMIEASGARARVEAMIEERMQEARVALGGLDLEGSGSDFLEGVMDYLRGRNR